MRFCLACFLANLLLACLAAFLVISGTWALVRGAGVGFRACGLGFAYLGAVGLNDFAWRWRDGWRPW